MRNELPIFVRVRILFAKPHYAQWHACIASKGLLWYGGHTISVLPHISCQKTNIRKKNFYSVAIFHFWGAKSLLRKNTGILHVTTRDDYPKKKNIVHAFLQPPFNFPCFYIRGNERSVITFRPPPSPECKTPSFGLIAMPSAALKARPQITKGRGKNGKVKYLIDAHNRMTHRTGPYIRKHNC